MFQFSQLRALHKMAALAVVAVLWVMAVPHVVLAQVADSASADPAMPATWHDLANYAITLALGLGAPYLMRGLESMSAWLQSKPAITKRSVVGAMTALVTLGCAVLAQHYPWFPWDPTPLNAMIATSIAFAAHAGDTAKDAKSAASDDPNQGS